MLSVMGDKIIVAGEKGKRTIVEVEAEIVRRIFDEYVAGRTPREIAHDLNNECILPPRGRSWQSNGGRMWRGDQTRLGHAVERSQAAATQDYRACRGWNVNIRVPWSRFNLQRNCRECRIQILSIPTTAPLID